MWRKNINFFILIPRFQKFFMDFFNPQTWTQTVFLFSWTGRRLKSNSDAADHSLAPPTDWDKQVRSQCETRSCPFYPPLRTFHLSAWKQATGRRAASPRALSQWPPGAAVVRICGPAKQDECSQTSWQESENELNCVTGARLWKSDGVRCKNRYLYFT